MYFISCPICGANLDPNENCESKYKETERAVFAQMLGKMIMGLEENADKEKTARSGGL